MIFASLGFARKLPVRLHAIWKMIHDPIYSRTYYPEEPRKSKARVLKDLLWWLIRHQEVNQYYYYYGLDRLQARADEFLIGYRFRKTRDRANAATNSLATQGDTRARSMNYRLLMGDKFVFNRFLAGLGIPVPEILALGDGKAIRWLKEGKELPVESIVDHPQEMFLKVLLADGGGQVYPLCSDHGRLIVDGREEPPVSFFRRLPAQYLIQERILQHPRLSELYPHSVNTFRVVTVFDGREVQPLSGVIRTGANGRRWDNWSTGGLVIAVDLDTGCLAEPGLRAPKHGGGRFARHPDTDVPFDGFEIPFCHEALRLAKLAHTYFYGFHSIGWDIGITPTGPTFIEANDDWSLEAVQGPHGPLKARFEALLPKPM